MPQYFFSPKLFHVRILLQSVRDSLNEAAMCACSIISPAGSLFFCADNFMKAVLPSHPYHVLYSSFPTFPNVLVTEPRDSCKTGTPHDSSNRAEMEGKNRTWFLSLSLQKELALFVAVSCPYRNWNMPTRIVYIWRSAREVLTKDEDQDGGHLCAVGFPISVSSPIKTQKRFFFLRLHNG